MKQWLIRLSIVISIILVLGLLWSVESTYTRTVTVVSCKDNIVTCQDNSGYVWQYKGIATIGDNITLIMSDNHTSKITDDIIKGVK